MKSGDVLFFHNLTIHRSVRNRSKNQIRLAASFRYQPRRDQVRSECMIAPHYLDPEQLSWDEVYDGWEADDPLRYYWKKWNLNFI